MRSRNIKPGFFKNDSLFEVDAFTRLLFVGLWLIADREGRLEDRPKRIKAEIFPADSVDVDSMLASLASIGLILRYETAGQRLIWIPGFKKHQQPHYKESVSTLPPPPSEPSAKVDSTLSQGRPMVDLPSADEGPPNPSDSLIPDSLIPDSLSLDSGASQTKAIPSAQPSAMQMDKSRDARELAEVYFRVVTAAHAGKGAAKDAILFAWDERPESSRAEFETSMRNYDRHCVAHNVSHRLSAPRFFREGTWVEFLEWTPPAVTPKARAPSSVTKPERHTSSRIMIEEEARAAR